MSAVTIVVTMEVTTTDASHGFGWYTRRVVVGLITAGLIALLGNIAGAWPWMLAGWAWVADSALPWLGAAVWSVLSFGVPVWVLVLAGVGILLFNLRAPADVPAPTSVEELTDDGPPRNAPELDRVAACMTHIMRLLAHENSLELSLSQPSRGFPNSQYTDLLIQEALVRLEKDLLIEAYRNTGMGRLSIYLRAGGQSLIVEKGWDRTPDSESHHK